ncbi:MAG: DEAD/DEAH box helicase [Cyclobacteriaceae bacterium]
MVTLRQYQRQDIDKIEETFARGILHVLYVLPTGCGKTTVFSSLAEKYFHQGEYVNIIVHRNELVEQIHDRLLSFGIEAGIIAGNTKPDLSKRVQVSSVQSLSRRNSPAADLVIIDEAHHCLASTYTRLWKEYPTSRILGVTATPIRLNGDGFDDHFEVMLNSRPLHWYFDNRYLVKPRHHVCANIDSKLIPTKDGDYDREVLDNIVKEGKVQADVLKAYQTYANEKKAVIFCQNINHSKSVAKLFTDNGIKASHLDGDTPEMDRKRIVRHFRSGRIKVLCNVDIVSEGFDIPDIEAVILAALSKSLAKYKQQVGRVLRLAPGKEFGLVLDCVGMWHEHMATASDDFEWNLKGQPKVKRDKPLFELPSDLCDEDFSDLPLFANDKKGNLVALSNSFDHPDVSEIPVDVSLIPIADHLSRLVVFEAYLAKAQKSGHKLLAAVFDYKRYVEMQNRGLDKQEITYCQNRIHQLGIEVKEGFWYYLSENSFKISA